MRSDGSRGRIATALALAAALGLALVGCRAPRDTALETKMHAVQAAEGAPAPAAAAAPKAPSAKPAGATAEPGFVTFKSYTTDQTARILARVEGDGPALRMTIETDQGAIRCALDATGTPQTVANVVALATGQSEWRDPDTDELFKTPFYDGLRFHRAISGFIIQTGNPGAKGAGGPGWTIPRERGAEGRFNQAGVLGMVDAGEDSHGSQFFITARPAKSLTDRYTAFGTCVDMARIIAISKAEKHPAGEGRKSATQPVDPVEIRTVRIHRGPPLPPEG